jgi:peptidoglycan/LPS O-acetylase OafA/YrhL
METATAPAARHVAALDGVRGLAVLLVMMNHFVHTAAGTVPESAAERLAHTGWRGVDLFFVLSGYLITSRLLAAPAEGYFRHFYARRALRILPLYYLALVTAYLSVPLLGPENARLMEGASHPVWFFLYVPNLAMAWAGGWLHTPRWFVLDHFWSLAVEEHFYLAWPWVTRFAPRRWLPAACVGLALAAAWLTQQLWAQGQPFRAYVLTPARLDGLALGAAWAAIAPNVATVRLHRPAAWALHLMLAASVAVIVGDLLPWPWIDRLALWTFVAMVVAASLEREGAPVVSWLAHPGLRWFGRYSYGLYVYHQLLQPVWKQLFAPASLIGALGSRGLGALAYSLLAGGASMALAWLSWHAIEKRVLAFKDRFAG